VRPTNTEFTHHVANLCKSENPRSWVQTLGRRQFILVTSTDLPINTDRICWSVSLMLYQLLRLYSSGQEVDYDNMEDTCKEAIVAYLKDCVKPQKNDNVSLGRRSDLRPHEHKRVRTTAGLRPICWFYNWHQTSLCMHEFHVLTAASMFSWLSRRVLCYKRTDVSEPSPGYSAGHLKDTRGPYIEDTSAQRYQQNRRLPPILTNTTERPSFEMYFLSLYDFQDSKKAGRRRTKHSWR
jgi:hypothetical protein